tara:strand:+ start:1460 stop:2713 length:1254 start_codon:yes stop_codon:yes gene_type:complete
MIRPNLSIVIIFILSTTLLFSERSSKDIQKDINNRNEKAESLKRDIEKLTDEIYNKKIESKTASNRLVDIQKKIELTGRLIDLLKKDESDLYLSISDRESTINNKKTELKALKEKFSKIIQYLYKSKNDNYLDLLLSSKNWEDMIYKIKYLEVISRQNKKIESDIEIIIDQLDNEIISLTNELLNKKNERKNKSNTITEFGIESNKEKNKINKIKQEKINLEQKKAKKKEQLAEITKLIQKLYINKDDAIDREEKLRKVREEKRKKELENAQKNKDFLSERGNLPWPVKGSIIKNFGIHNKDGVEERNIRIEIKTQKNEKVKAVFDGVVAEIGYNLGYNTYVIIDHGGGYSTLYANLDDKSIQVSNQDYIESEAIIGNTLNILDNKKNQSYGLLYFMIFEVNDKQKVTPQNPRKWIK